MATASCGACRWVTLSKLVEFVPSVVPPRSQQLQRNDVFFSVPSCRCLCVPDLSDPHCPWLSRSSRQSSPTHDRSEGTKDMTGCALDPQKRWAFACQESRHSTAGNGIPCAFGRKATASARAILKTWSLQVIKSAHRSAD